jgi:hypothetical protein
VTVRRHIRVTRRRVTALRLELGPGEATEERRLVHRHFLPVGRLLAGLSRLHLGLNGCGMSTGDVWRLCRTIADHLAGLRHLVLHLRNNNVGQCSTESPVLPLRRLLQLEHLDLDLSRNQLRPHTVEGTVFAVACLPRLGSLRLALAEHAVYVDAGLLSFADRMTSLYLDLNGNRINPHRLAGLSQLSRLVSAVLLLAECNAGDVVAVAVARLHACTQLQTLQLNLRGNALTGEGLTALSVLRHSAHLRTLDVDVSDNPLGAGALAGFLVRGATSVVHRRQRLLPAQPPARPVEGAN